MSRGGSGGQSRSESFLCGAPGNFSTQFFQAQYDYDPVENYLEQQASRGGTLTNDDHGLYQNVPLNNSHGLGSGDSGEASKDEIKLAKDDKLLLLDERKLHNDGWWLGQLLPDPEININAYFQVGVFPKEYVVALGPS